MSVVDIFFAASMVAFGMLLSTFGIMSDCEKTHEYTPTFAKEVRIKCEVLEKSKQ